MVVLVQDPAIAAVEDNQTIRSRALTWLRGDLPTYPFEGFEELDRVDVPLTIVPPGRGDILDQLFPPDNLLGIRVERRFRGDQLEGYRLHAGGLVGLATVGDRKRDETFATVTVQPKVPGSSLLTMLSYALVPDLSSEHRPEIDVKDMPIVSLVLLIYLLRLQQLIESHGLQRAYIRLEESLRGTIRGRCVLPTYLQRNIPTGRSHIVPCDFWELRVDSEPNRALRWGIEVCRVLADHLCRPELTQNVEGLWGALAPHFAGIPVIPCQASQVRRLPRSGRFAPYAPVLELLEFLLDHLSFDIKQGRVHVRGFAVEMWDVFERFVVNVLASHMQAQVQGPQVRFGCEIVSEKGRLVEKNIYLDALVRGQRTLVVDAKWKEGIISYTADSQEEGDVLKLEGLHIGNADLFQVVAYGRHRDIQAHGSLLVYPVLEAESVCRKRFILDFLNGTGDSPPYPVFLIGIPVGAMLHQSIDNFVSIVDEVAARPIELETGATTGR